MKTTTVTTTRTVDAYEMTNIEGVKIMGFSTLTRALSCALRAEKANQLVTVRETFTGSVVWMAL